MTIYQGRPLDGAGREEKEIRVYDLLDSLEIPFLRVDHEPAMTIEACREVEETLDIAVAKNLFLCNRQKTRFYLLVMPGEKPFKTKELSAQIHSARLSFGTPEDMERLLDITPGSVSILGLMNDAGGEVQLLVDEDILAREYFACHPCINTSSLKMRTADVMERFLPAIRHEGIPVHLEGR